MGCHPGGPYLPSQVSLQEKGRGRGCDTDIRQALRPRRERLNSDKATNQGLAVSQKILRKHVPSPADTLDLGSVVPISDLASKIVRE